MLYMSVCYVCLLLVHVCVVSVCLISFDVDCVLLMPGIHNLVSLIDRTIHSEAAGLYPCAIILFEIFRWWKTAAPYAG